MRNHSYEEILGQSEAKFEKNTETFDDVFQNLLQECSFWFHLTTVLIWWWLDHFYGFMADKIHNILSEEVIGLIFFWKIRENKIN